MLATFWFLIKLCLFIGLFALLLGLGGHVTVSVAAYKVSTTLGLFLVVLLGFMWIVSLVFRAVHFIQTAPQAISRHREIKAHRKGLQALAQGMSAIAAGDVKAARQATRRVIRYLHREDYGLSDLMSALTARLQGDEVQMRRSYHAMMLHKETSFLGLKGLLQSAMEKKDYRYAAILAEKAYQKHSDNDWIVSVLFDLRVLTGEYGAAERLLDKAAKAKGLTPWVAESHKAALLYEEGETSRAYKVDPYFLPAVLGMLADWTAQGKNRKAKKVIKKVWAQQPHPALMDYWVRCAPKKALDNLQAMATWVEELQRENPEDEASSLYAGEALYHMGQKDPAKRFIKQAIRQKPTVSAVRLMAQIEGADYWNTQMQNALHDKAWVCSVTGQVHSQWQIVTDDGHVNCLVWAYPDSITVEQDHGHVHSLLAA